MATLFFRYGFSWRLGNIFLIFVGSDSRDSSVARVFRVGAEDVVKTAGPPRSKNEIRPVERARRNKDRRT